MKKTLVIAFVSIILCSFKFADEPNPLLGKWEWKKVFKDGPLAILVHFRTNGTYDGFANQKSFVTGGYRLKKDTLYISDPICNSGYEGKYKITFFGKQDSVRFDLISDTCNARARGIDGNTYKRINTTLK